MIRLNNSSFNTLKVGALYFHVKDSDNNIIDTNRITWNNFAYDQIFYDRATTGYDDDGNEIKTYESRFKYVKAIGQNYTQLVVLNGDTADRTFGHILNLKQSYVYNGKTFTVIKLGTITISN